MNNYRVFIGRLGKNISVSRFQGSEEGGTFTDCAEIEMTRKDGKPVVLRLSREEVHELVGLLAKSFSNDMFV